MIPSPRHNPQKARAHYQALDLSSRVEGASPHALVAMLYDELLGSLDIIAAAMRRDADITHVHSADRARSILIALIGSLDHQNGGPLAQTLGAVYRAMIGQLAKAVTEHDINKLHILREGVLDVATAWNALRA